MLMQKKFLLAWGGGGGGGGGEGAGYIIGNVRLVNSFTDS